MFKSALPAFCALREFEWIGYPELRADMVQAVLQTHPHLHTLGLIGWHFDAVGVVCGVSYSIFTKGPSNDPHLVGVQWPPEVHTACRG